MPELSRRAVLGFLLLVLGIGVIGFLVGRASAPRAPQPRMTPIEDGSPVEATTRVVRLFFAAPAAEKLREEQREIPRAASFVGEAARTVEELIKGPQGDLNPTIPPGAELRQLYIDGQGTAYVDFFRDLQTKHPGGTVGELLTIYSIVDTLTANYEEIERVKILIEGSEVLTLAGHIDTRHPFRPRFSLGRVR